MKATPTILALMTALAVGSASAATTNTTAGQIITNQATATFTDPTSSTGAAATPIVSNKVETVVLPKPSFDIQYADGSADNTTATTPAASYDKTGVLPGATVTTAYVVVNTGNVNGYVVNLASDSTGGNAPQQVKYYLDANNDGVPDSGTPVTSVTLSADNPGTPADEGVVRILQVITVATSAATGAQYSASPAGSAPAGSVSVTDSSGTTTTYPYAALTEAQANSGSSNGDLQYTRVTVFTPTVTAGPYDADPATAGQQAPTSTVVVPPSASTTIDPNNPTSAPGTPSSPSDPTQPGYTDPAVPASTGSTAITVVGNVQTAYPPADTNAAPDVVNFKNSVTTPSGAPADTVNLFPLDPSKNVGDAGYGAPYGTNNGDGSFTLPDGTIMKFLNADGTAATLVTSPVDGKAYPVVTVAAGGGTVGYITQVTYPDSNSLANPTPITVVVGVDSGNDYNLVADASTTDRILPPALQFGDSDGTQTPPTANASATPTETVTPGTAASSGAPTAGVTTDSSAVFPMDVANPGEYADTYTLSGSVTVPLSDGTSATVSVKYVTAAGTALPKNSAGQYITPVVDANTEYKVYAVVDLPANAKLTLPGSPLLVAQTATSNYSNITLTDTNDRILVGAIGGITVNKYQAVGAAPTQNAAGQTTKSALPGDTIYYAIVASNSYNSAIKNFVLSDAAGGNTNVYSFSTFKAASVTLTGFPASAKVMYRLNGTGSFSISVPAAGSVTSGVEVAIDTDGDGLLEPTTDDLFPSGGTITLNIQAQVK
ncbi:hypothetical protein E7T09_09935 [Deinococcus sp. KSM4-11]|uniref:beta strand repeat-containing protein n=1 Tax=Deinococcus sp. KSM4-11 TaxID=2568654 RepID=UPI0010A3B6E8|nr:hypothetical protein [Deinococcus sp. KSM4-11]THF86441.1 hypothetical protein E7T09_09935 [Deinococcus sp. KSM4-11]